MNQNQPTNPTPLPDASVIQERVAASVHSHQRKIRVLTGMAFLFGFLAITASIAIVSAYFVLYLPKQRQMLQDFGASARLAHAAPEENSSKPKYDFAATEVRRWIRLGARVAACLVARGSRARSSEDRPTENHRQKQSGHLHPRSLAANGAW